MNTPKQPQITVEVPTAQTYQPVSMPHNRRQDRLEEFRYNLLDKLIPDKNWEDIVLEVVTHLATPAFITSIIGALTTVGVAIAPTLIALFAAVIMVSLAVLWWVARTVPEAAVLIGVRLFLILAGVFMGIIL